MCGQSLAWDQHYKYNSEFTGDIFWTHFQVWGVHGDKGCRESLRQWKQYEVLSQVCFTHFPTSFLESVSPSWNQRSLTGLANQLDPEILSPWLLSTRITDSLLDPVCIYMGSWVLNASPHACCLQGVLLFFLLLWHNLIKRGRKGWFGLYFI